MRSVGFGKIGKISCLVMIICVFSFSVASAGWHQATIHKITPKTDGDGDVFVQFESATSPPEWQGLARGIVDATEPGFNTLVATLLTALSLGYEIVVRVDNTPSFDNPQVITGLTVEAP